MIKKNLFEFVFVTGLIAFLLIACDMGTAEWPTETPHLPFTMSAIVTEDRKGVDLKWYAPETGDEVRGYEVYRWNDSIIGRNPDVTFKYVRDTFYTDTENIAAGSRYFYKVRAYNGSGLGREDSSIYMASIVIPPLQVQNLKAKELNSYTIQLNWDASVGATEYYVFRLNKLTGNYDSIAAVSAPSIIHFDDNNGKGLEAHTWYYYKIQASNTTQNGGKSPMSEVDSAKTKLAPPAWLRVDILPDDNVKIRWTAVNGAIGYQLFYESGLTNATWEYAIAFDKDTIKFDAGNMSKNFRKYSAIAPDTLDTLEFIDKGFKDFGLTAGTTLFYTACGIEKFDSNGDYRKDIIGDKWIAGARGCSGRWSDTKPQPQP